MLNWENYHEIVILLPKILLFYQEVVFYSHRNDSKMKL